jgi:hypothetical protein
MPTVLFRGLVQCCDDSKSARPLLREKAEHFAKGRLRSAALSMITKISDRATNEHIRLNAKWQIAALQYDLEKATILKQQTMVAKEARQRAKRHRGNTKQWRTHNLL